jgi:hypothetical protein
VITRAHGVLVLSLKTGVGALAGAAGGAGHVTIDQMNALASSPASTPPMIGPMTGTQA